MDTASPDILKELFIVDGFDVETLTLLMLKYGHAMCWPRKDPMKYLIQSLFPVVPSSSTSNAGYTTMR
jgi:hypothetical protein